MRLGRAAHARSLPSRRWARAGPCSFAASEGSAAAAAAAAGGARSPAPGEGPSAGEAGTGPGLDAWVIGKWIGGWTPRSPGKESIGVLVHRFRRDCIGA